MIADKFTLVVPTHNRHHYLKRFLSYYAQQNCNFNIIICDSSEESFMKIDSFKNKLNISYFHFPDFSYSDKLCLISDKIVTEYVSFCADDDFIFIDSIIACINFLQTNPAYTSVQGKYIGFIKTGELITSYPMYGHTYNVNLVNNTSSARLKLYNQNYFLSVYSIYRANVFKKIINSFKNIKNLNLLELLMGYTAIIEGGHKVLPILYAAREKIVGSLGTTVESIESCYHDPKHKMDLDNFINTVSASLCKKEGITLEMARAYIHEMANLYLESQKSVETSIVIENTRVGVVRKSKDLVKSIVPKKIIFKIHQYSHEKSCKKHIQKALSFSSRDELLYSSFISFIKSYEKKYQ